MLQLINDLPPHVVGVRATGNVTKQDLDTVLLPALDELVERTDSIRYMLVLDTDLSDWDLGAWVSDAKAGIKHFSKWDRIAVVTDKTAVQKFTDAFTALIPGKAKGFEPQELDAAKKWVAE